MPMMRDDRKRYLTGAGALALAVTLTACGPDRTPTQQPNDDGEIILIPHMRRA
jgi:hypothetical protein